VFFTHEGPILFFFSPGIALVDVGLLQLTCFFPAMCISSFPGLDISSTLRHDDTNFQRERARPVSMSRAIPGRQTQPLFSDLRAHLAFTLNASDEAWRRISQVLEDIVASHVDATVKPSLACYVSNIS